jgi:hypothetical protein
MMRTAATKMPSKEIPNSISLPAKPDVEAGGIGPQGEGRARVRLVVGVWAAWSVGILILASAARRLPVSQPDAWSPNLMSIAPALARWDSGWYYQIAKEGYRYDPHIAQNNVAFYPLYPLLMRWVSTVIPVSAFTAGIAISLLSLLGALLFVDRLTVDWGDPAATLTTAGALLFYPTAFFLAAAYTESLFLLATTAALWAAHNRRWWLCGVAGAAASLTRFNGFLILLPIIWLIAADIGGCLRSLHARHVFATAATLAGISAYPLFLWRRWGDPLLYVHGKSAGWAQKPRAPWRLISDLLREAASQLLHSPAAGGKLIFSLEVGSLLLFSVLTVALFRKGHVAEGIYCAATLLFLLCSGTLDGIHRYVLALFPCYFILGQTMRRHPVAALGYCYLGAGLCVTLLTRYVHWFPVG